ncbi:MAG: hypothetical protein RI967_1224 [Planctomycetota bacterium]|jgi:hypothetical protein
MHVHRGAAQAFLSPLLPAVLPAVLPALLLPALVVATPSSAAPVATESPFAATLVAYDAGSGAAPGFTNAIAALGSPERFTGEGLIPSCVTPFQPAFRPDEIVSIGVGGSLVVAFDHEVVDDPRNPFGIDLLVFGNAFFTDQSFGGGVVAGLASEGGAIEVSADGETFVEVRKLEADGLFPTLGFLDAGPYATVAGGIESDFLRPVDPAWTMGTIVGLGYDSLLDAYDGSGGGVGIDLARTGLASIRFVRIRGPLVPGFSPEIDAFADVAPLAASPDLDGDGTVGAGDLAILLGAWGGPHAAADLDANGLVEAADLAALLAAWGAVQP